MFLVLFLLQLYAIKSSLKIHITICISSKQSNGKKLLQKYVSKFDKHTSHYYKNPLQIIFHPSLQLYCLHNILEVGGVSTMQIM